MRPNLADILKATLQVLDVEETEWEQHKKSRQSTIIGAKELFCFLARKKGYTYSKITSYLGISHAAAINHVKKFKAYCDVYPQYVKLVQDAKALIPDVMVSHVSPAWLARGKSGMLVISPSELEDLNGYWIAPMVKIYEPQDAFPQITYEAGPVKVSIKVTIEEDEKV